MAKIAHFLYTPFTGLGLKGGYRGDKWFKNRVEIFKEYTLKAVMNQDNKNFVHWISFRPKDRKNPLVQSLKFYLEHLRGYECVITFDGLCFWDDKFPAFPLLKNLEKTLPELAPHCEGFDWVYMTIQPSDDMYSKTVVNDLQLIEPKEKLAMGFKPGYIMNYCTGEMAEYNPETNPPFYTICFPVEKFLNPYNHIDYTGPYESHEYIPNHFEYLQLQGRKYCVGTHGENISTAWNHPYMGELYEPENALEFMKGEFGISDSKPLVMKKRLYIRLRDIFNRLPFNGLIYLIYKYVRR